MPPSIFLSYRRGDEPWAALSIANALHNEMEHYSIFMDVDLNIGQTFPDILRREIDQCKAMIVAIGRNWNSIDHHTNNRQLFDENDWVRREIELALSGGKIIFPIRIGGAPRLKRDELPPSLHRLLNEQDYDLSEPRYFAREMGALTNQLRKAVGSRRTWRDRIPFRNKKEVGGVSSDPGIPAALQADQAAYGHVSGCWHEYHITFEPLKNDRIIAHATINFSLDEQLNLTGQGHFPTQNRKVLHYFYTGFIRGGT